MTTAVSRASRPRVVGEWFLLPDPQRASVLRLFCFPHAGGDATAFAPLAHALAPAIEVWGLRLPGRGGRLGELMPADFDELVRTVVDVMLAHTGTDFGIYGQSLGAMLAYEVARALPAGHRPRFVVAASAHAPQRWAPELPARLDAARLLAAAGLTELVGQDAELMKMTLSITQADLELCRTYRYRPGPLSGVRLHAVAGADDPLVTGWDLLAWAEVAGPGMRAAVVEGGHLLAVPTSPGPVEFLRAVAHPGAGQSQPPAASQEEVMPTDWVADLSDPAFDLSDTAFWARPDLAALIGRLRSESPVQRSAVAQDGPVWSVFSYELGARVLGAAETFSSTGGSLLGSSPDGSPPAGSGKMMAMCDRPRHRMVRAPVAPFFNATSVASYKPKLAAFAERAAQAGIEKGDVNFVDVIGAVPLFVMCDMLDIPDADRNLVVAFCDNAFLGATAQARRAGHQELIRYLFMHAVAHRARPAGDLVSILATHRVDGTMLPIEDVVLNLDNILVGGVQTVRHTAAMSMLTLLRNPDQLDALWAGQVAMDRAIDELLRWTSSGLHVLRTASRDVTLGPASVRAGDKVVVWTWAANHDPAQFDSPDDLMLDRSPNQHLALGWGSHFCVGAALAKAELAAIFTALRDQVQEVRLTGTPRHNKSIINFGLDELPVRLVGR